MHKSPLFENHWVRQWQGEKVKSEAYPTTGIEVAVSSGYWDLSLSLSGAKRGIGQILNLCAKHGLSVSGKSQSFCEISSPLFYR